jgi:enoyl-CoA hydratase/carnithine racemase
MDEFIKYKVIDHIAWITMKRNPSNAFNIEFLDEILNTLKIASKDKDVRVIIIESDINKIFSAGLDLNLLLNKSGLEIREFLKRLYVDLWDIQYNMGKPTIALINGAARGGGMTLAISCDIIIASEKASFGYPEINLGLLPAIHFTHLPKVVGRYKAFDLLFSGRTFYSDEAFMLGLISRKVLSAEIKKKVTEIAINLSKKSSTAMSLGRAAFLRTNDLDYRRGVANAVEDFCNAAITPDAQEGLKAFVEKRQPVWK